MARLIPDIIHPDVKSNAERKIFETIRSSGDTDRWVCLHSLGLGRHEHQRCGEIDFLLITENGLFVLEVKGGRIRRQDGRWIYTNRYDKEHSTTRGPFEQARDAMFSLERRLKDRFGRDSDATRLLFGYGVITPDCVLKEEIEQHEGAEVAGLVYDADDRVHSFRRYVDRLTQTTRAMQPGRRMAPSDKQRKAIVSYLRGDFEAVLPLWIETESVKRAIRSLEPAQCDVLDSIDDQPRMIIQGGAGTGKTLLALESARRAVFRGKSVLLLCYNRLLARALQDTIEKARIGNHIKVCSLYSYLHQLVEESPFRSDYESACAGISKNEIYGKVLPEYAQLAAMDDEGPRFDQLIVDEAQDVMSAPVLDVLEVLVKGGLSHGAWQFFLDSNDQAAVYGRCKEGSLARLRADGNQCVLIRNCRNTKQIAQETKLLAQPTAISSSSIDGGPVTYGWIRADSDQSVEICQQINKLVGKDGLRPGQITILSPHASPTWLSDVISNADCPVMSLSEGLIPKLLADDLPSVTFATVSAFKGLENDFIIVADVENVTDDWWRAVIYVAMTRARVRLIMMVRADLKDEYTKRVQQAMERMRLDDDTVPSS